MRSGVAMRTPYAPVERVKKASSAWASSAGAAGGIVHLDDDVSAALGGRQLCLSIRRGPESEPAWRHCPPPAEMPLRRAAIEPADIAHVGETLGREVNGTLA